MLQVKGANRLFIMLSLFCLAVVADTGKVDSKTTMLGEDLLKEIEAGSAPLIIDVRSEWEYRRGHVPGAVHLPFHSTFTRHGDLAVARDQPVLLYCEHGPRAYIARMALRRAGFQNILLLKSHMRGWKKNGFPVE